MIAAAKEPRGDVVEIPFAGHNFRVAVAPLSGIIRDVKIDGAWWSAREVLSNELIAELQRELAGMPSNKDGESIAFEYVRGRVAAETAAVAKAFSS